MKIELNKTSAAAKTAQAFGMLMGQSSQQGITQIPPEQLIPYPNQPFKPYAADKLQELAEDIKEQGITSPVTVRPLGDGTYQILSGHNRTNAGKLAGLQTIPCIIRDVDDSAAEQIMLNANLQQRHELLPSEKAFAYKQLMDNSKKQGKRTDLTSSTLETKSDTATEIGEHHKESRANIFRYICLTYLIPEFLKMVDADELPVRAGEHLSYLSADSQERLYDYIQTNEIRLSVKQAEKLRSLLQAPMNFNEDSVDYFSMNFWKIFLLRNRAAQSRRKYP